MASPPNRKKPSSGISIQTLVIASVASAAASLLASRLWGAGTLVSAALTPVVVALVSEFLRRPVERVSSVAKTPTIHGVATSRWPMSPPGESARFAEEPESFAEEPPAEGESTANAEEQAASGEESAGSAGRPARSPGQRPGSAEGNETVIDSSRRRWRLALITGLTAFVIVVAVYTLTDVLAGQAITGSGAPTTFFGGASSTSSSRSSTTSSSSTSPTTTTVTKTTTTATSSKPSSTSSTSSTSSSSGRTSPTTNSTTSSTSSRAAPGAPAPNTSTAIGP